MKILIFFLILPIITSLCLWSYTITPPQEGMMFISPKLGDHTVECNDVITYNIKTTKEYVVIRVMDGNDPIWIGNSSGVAGYITINNRSYVSTVIVIS